MMSNIIASHFQNQCIQDGIYLTQAISRVRKKHVHSQIIFALVVCVIVDFIATPLCPSLFETTSVLFACVSLIHTS